MVAVCLFGKEFSDCFRDPIANQVTLQIPCNNVRAFPFTGQPAIYTYFLCGIVQSCYTLASASES